MSRTDRATTINSILRDVVVSQSATALAGVFKTRCLGTKPNSTAFNANVGWAIRACGLRPRLYQRVTRVTLHPKGTERRLAQGDRTSDPMTSSSASVGGSRESIGIVGSDFTEIAPLQDSLFYLAGTFV